MKKKLNIIGIFGLVFLVFGLITSYVTSYDKFYFAPIHYTLGGLLVCAFILFGGLKSFYFRRAGDLHRAEDLPSEEHKTAINLQKIFGSVLFLGIIVIANLIGAKQQFFYLDTTKEKVYSLAPQIEKIIGNITSEIKITAFYLGSQVSKEVANTLKLMALSKNISLQVIDPEANPEIAQSYKITQSGTIIFEQAGSSTRISGKIGEQEIASALLKLSRGGEKVVYYIVGHGEPDIESYKENGYRDLKEAIFEENISLKEIKLWEVKQIPKDASAIIFAAPHQSLGAGELSILSSYLFQGGRALLLNEPNTTDDIIKISDPIGITVGNDVVIDENQMAGKSTMGVTPLITTYIEHEITKNFNQGVILATASSVKAKDPSNLSVTELAITGEKSWAEKRLDLVFSSPAKAAFEAEDIKGPIPVAAAAEIKNGSSKGGFSRIVVFGDSDFVRNSQIRQVFNRDFFLNCLNWVIGSDYAIAIRPRNLLEARVGITAEQFDKLFLLCVIALPEIILLSGLLFWWSRK